MSNKITKLVGHTLVYGIGNSGSRFVGFLLIPLYTHYLTPEDYGVLALVGLLGQILFIVVSMGQGTAVFRTYFNHEDPARRNEVITTSLWLIFLVSMPLSLLTLALNTPITVVLTGKSDYTVWVMLGTLAVAFKCLMRLPMSLLRAREQSWQYSLWSFIQTVSTLVTTIAFVAWWHQGGKGVLLSQLVGEVIVCAYLVPATLKGMPLKFSRTEAWDMLGYGAYQIPTALFGFLLHMSDRYFLKHYTTLHDVGLYSLGYRFGEILLVPLWAFGLAYYPFLFEHQKDKDAPALYARVCTYFTAVMAMLWLIVSLVAPEAITIMARPAFHEGYRVVPWIAGAFFFQAVGFVWSVGLVMHRKVKRRPAIVATATLANLALNYFLVPRYGMMGAAWAGLFSFVVWFVLQAVLAHQLYAVPYEWGRVTRLCAVVTVVYAVGMSFTWGSPWTSLIAKSVMLVCTPLLLYASGFFVTGELSKVTQLVLRKRFRSFAAAPGGK